MLRNKMPTIFLILIHVFLAHPIWAGSCDVVTGEVDTTLDLESFEGAGTFTINDDQTYRIEVEGVNLGFTDTEEDGTQHVVTSTDWRLKANGVRFTTFEDARLEPTDTPGVFSYVGRSRVETGNRRYNCGELVIQGEIDFNMGIGSFPIIRGKLCRCDSRQSASRRPRPSTPRP